MNLWLILGTSFAPLLAQSAYAFVLVHNHPSGESAPSDADIRLTRRLAEGGRILQINMLDHVIVGQSFDGRPGYFSFKEAGMIL
jgi:DNA repair protein RadC